MQPAWPEQFQGAHEHNYIALCINKLKKYKRMKPARPERIQDAHEHDYIAPGVS
ncbi:MAG: hypothetical protein MI975_19220 [Cytophagales bacterium]|nr:hypothetical protein [Cytophagales bacterium]